MAKVYKAEIYISDYNGEIQDVNHLKDVLENLGYKLWVDIKIANIKESKEFGWNDDLKINKKDATIEDFEEYFKDL